MNLIRPELLSLSTEQIHALMPYFWLFFGSIVAMVAAVVRVVSPKWPVFLVTLATAGGAISASLALIHDQPMLLFNGMMVSDAYSNLFNVIFLASAALTTLASLRYLDNERLQHPEYFLLLLFSAFGMMLMGSSLDLIVTFIALELMSLAVYVLVGFRRADRRSNEGAMKYFILGSAASAVLLYGTALLYGTTGSTNFRTILGFISTHPQGTTMVYTLGVWMVVLGFLFKVAAVPFHMWMPDVYEGAPAPVTGFMTTGLKAAAFAAFVRVFISMGYGKGIAAIVQTHIHDILWVVAVLT
ncbi:MAG: NADH-quinone oxidoreductase subunit N, partial [Bdellovibrionota bacterium]